MRRRLFSIGVSLIVWVHFNVYSRKNTRRKQRVFITSHSTQLIGLRFIIVLRRNVNVSECTKAYITIMY